MGQARSVQADHQLTGYHITWSGMQPESDLRAIKSGHQLTYLIRCVCASASCCTVHTSSPHSRTIDTYQLPHRAYVRSSSCVSSLGEPERTMERTNLKRIKYVQTRGPGGARTEGGGAGRGARSAASGPASWTWLTAPGRCRCALGKSTLLVNVS